MKPDRRAVYVHAQVVVAATNGITTARAIIPPVLLNEALRHDAELARWPSGLPPVAAGLRRSTSEARTVPSYFMCSRRNIRQLADMSLSNRTSRSVDRLVTLPWQRGGI